MLVLAKDNIRDEKGAVAIIVAAALVALLLSLAVVVDTGLLYQERRQLQSSTDAAALAAAIDIAEGKGADQASSRAIEYVSANANVPPSQVTVDFPAANRIRVVTKTERSIFFAGFFGREKAPVIAKSTAALGAASGVSKLVPFIVPLQKVPDYTGSSNAGTFEIGEDRPFDPFSKAQSISGDTITYTITYNNTGNKVEDVVVRDAIPSGTIYINGTVTAGGVYDPSTKEIAWNFTGVVPGDYRIMRFSVKVTSGSISSISNTAYAVTSSSGKILSASTGSSAQRGYFWLCNFNGGSGGIPEYDSWIRHGFPDYVYAGSTANGVGVKASLKDALNWRKSSDSNVLVPVYSYTEGGGSPGTYHVVGFAEFVITSFNFSGQPKTISGYFTDGTVASGVPGPAPEGYFGVDTVWLVD